MNNKSLILQLLIGTFAFTTFAAVEWMPVATPGESFFFELRNRTSKPLYIRLYDGKNNDLLYELNTFTGERKDFLLLGRSTLSYIKESAIPVVRLSGQPPKKLILSIAHEPGSESREWFSIDLNNHSTAFVSYENGAIRPQQGRKGLTISGLPLEGNVTWREIGRINR